MAELAELIAKLEAATGPSKELDARIYAATLHPHGFDRMAEKDHNSCDAGSYCWHDAAGNRVTCWRDKAFTHSVDAAMALLPTGWRLAGLWEARDPKHRPWWGVEVAADEPYEFQRTLGAKTAPLAICNAALKARSASSPRPDPSE